MMPPVGNGFLCSFSSKDSHHTGNSNTDPYVSIKNYLNQGRPREAIQLYNRVRSNRIHILSLAPLAAKACGSLLLTCYGRSLHAELIKLGVEFDAVIGTSLVDMYGRCGIIVDARKMFDGMPNRNVVTWNAMLGGYFRNRDTKSASLLFDHMPMRSEVTWVEMISGLARNGDLLTARRIFDQVPVEMRTVITWTVMVDGYTRNGEMEAAKEIFEMMPERNSFVWSSMISGYSRKGDAKQAKAIFDHIPVKNLVNWNSLISGYVQNGSCTEALAAFEKMQSEGFDPDEVTIVSILSACAQLGLLDLGKKIHILVKTWDRSPNQFVLSALIDMYAKCGDLSCARDIFNAMCHRNCACWNAIISGFAVNGECREALQFFERMESSNETPDELTFLSVLSACAHGGFVDEGLKTFSKMEKYGLAASVKHYGCLVDLLGRAGRLGEAYDLIMNMPMQPNDTVWGALLAACRIHSNMGMAESVVRTVNSSNVDAASNYGMHHMLMSNIYAESNRWEKAEKMRLEMVKRRLQKVRGCSSITSSHDLELQLAS